MTKVDIDQVIDRLIGMGYLKEKDGRGSPVAVTELGQEYAYQLADRLVDRLVLTQQIKVSNYPDRDSVVRAVILGYLDEFECGASAVVKMYMDLEGDRPGSA